MTKKEKFFKHIEENKCKPIGQFLNDCGEEFVIYQYQHMSLVYVSGDEIDWELGWLWLGKGELNQVFLLSREETQHIRKLVKAANII